jgi:2-polyprenyl-3-methyl-5-hydroxy-6-metoxy-1,4-benzoquinol methylase
VAKRALRRIHQSWEQYGTEDPLWAVLTTPAARGGKWDVGAFLRSGHGTIEEALASVAALGIELPDGPALDFGCGVGRLTQSLAEHFPEVHGVDISESMIAEAERLNPFGNRCQFHVNTAPDLGLFDDESFAFVTSFLVLQHMPASTSLMFLAEFARVLRPGGAIVIQIPLRRRSLRGAWANRARNLAVRGRLRILGRPGMEMHPISVKRVSRALSAAGAPVVSAQPSVAGDWHDIHYVATRPRA